MEVWKVNVNISDTQSYKTHPQQTRVKTPKPSNKTVFNFQLMYEFIDVTANVTTITKYHYHNLAGRH